MSKETHPLVGLVKAATERGKKAKGDAPSNSSLAAYLVFLGLAVLGFAVMGFLLVRARRKAAKMELKLRKLEEEHRRAVEDSKLAQTAERRESAYYESRHLYEEVDTLKKEIKRNKGIATERVKAVQEAMSWKELGL